MKKIVLLITIMLTAVMFTITSYAETSSIVGPSVIHKQSNHILTISNILQLYSSNDGSVVIQSDEFTGYGNIPGEHKIVLKVIDEEVEHLKEVSVIVVGELGNVKAVSDRKDLHIRTTQNLTPQDIVSVLQKTGYVQITADTQMMIINDTYTINSEVEGQYLFEFRLINSAGDDEVYTSIINVSDSDGFFVPDLIIKKPTTGVNKVWLFIKTAFSDWIWPIIYNALTFLILGIIVIFLYRKYKKKGTR